jgi:hypothetical protein
VYFLKIDISSAFDSIEYPPLLAALQHAGVPDTVSLALLRELYGSSVVGWVDDICSGDPVIMQKGGRQGSPETPLLWNVYLSKCLKQLYERWVFQGWGGFLERAASAQGTTTGPPHCHSEGPTPLLAWADDLVLSSHSLAELQQMATELVTTLRTDGLQIKPSKVELLAGKWAAPGSVTVAGTMVHSECHMRVLGAVLCDDGSARAHAEDRLQKAAAAFHSCRRALCNRRVPLRSRVAIWQAKVLPVLTWACQCFPTSQNFWRRADSLMTCHMATMGPRARANDETLAEWFQRRRRMAKDNIQRWNVTVPSQALMRMYLTWAGHMARQHGLASRLYLWRDLSRWAGHLREGTQQSRQRRASGRPVRWEETVVHCAGEEWTVRAQDRQDWQRLCDQYIRKFGQTRRYLGWHSRG